MDDFAQLPDVAVLDMAAVFAQVSGNAVRAGRFAHQRRLDRVGLAVAASPVTRFTKGGDVVDIDTQLEHGLAAQRPGAFWGDATGAPAAADAFAAGGDCNRSGKSKL